jgi:hypothetical protein
MLSGTGSSTGLYTINLSDLIVQHRSNYLIGIANDSNKTVMLIYCGRLSIFHVWIIQLIDYYQIATLCH